MGSTRKGIAVAGVAALVALGGYAGSTLAMPGTPLSWPSARADAMGTGGMGMGSGMSMSSGMSSIQAGADRMFAVQMVPHHESAVQMSRLALERAQRPEVKALAEDIIRTQTAEIDQLRAAAQRLGPDAGGDRPRAGSGMGMGSTMGTDLGEVPAGDAFDRAFVEAMIPHHQMGVHMAQMVQRHGSDPQIQALAADMVEVQTREITLMQGWLD